MPSAFNKMGHGSCFCDPTQEQFYECIAQMYFADETNYMNEFISWLHSPADQLEVVDKLQKDAQIWEQLLHTSGGALRTEKCLYYALTWDFDEYGKATIVQLILTSASSSLGYRA
jgi:hypothetical protein